jgi:hypothetical protein
MPQIVVAAVKFVAVKVFSAAAIKTLGVQLIATVALSAVSKALTPKPKSGWRGDSLQVSLDPNQNRVCVVGQTATAGSLVTFQTWGAKNEYIILLFALADHPCDSLVGVWNNGKRLTLNGDGSVQDYYADGRHNLWITFYGGDWNQAADSELISVSGGRWTANDRGRGVCYVKVKARYNEKAHGEGLSGLFQFLYEIKGAKLYDRRLDGSVGGSGSQRANDQASWTWSDNAAVVLENLLRGMGAEDTGTAVASRQRDLIFGPGLGDSDMPFAPNIAAMNACDELVSLKAGGSEKRYRASGVFSVAATPRQVAEDVLAAMAGKLTTGPGRWRILPGVAQSVVKYITDDDIRIDVSSSYTQDKPLDETVNAVYGRFADPSAYYQPISLPARLSSADEATDGGRKAETYELSYVTSGTQGQRVQEIHRRRGRRMRAAKMALAPEHMDLEPGDWISWTSARYGWTKTFEITPIDITTDGDDFLAVNLALGEVDSSLYSWTAATDQLDPAVATDLSSALITGSAVTGLTVAATTIAQGATQIPALAVTYTAITDTIAVTLRLEYRVQGLPAAAAQTFVKEFALRPTEAVSGSTVSLVLSDGVIGGYVYQVRGAVLTSPERDLTYSAWVSTAASTGELSVGSIGGLGPNDINNALVVSIGGLGPNDINNALVVPAAVNRLRYSRWEAGVLTGWAVYDPTARNPTLTNFWPNGYLGRYPARLGGTASAANQAVVLFAAPAFRFAVKAVERLSVQALVEAQNGAGQVELTFYDAAGASLGTVAAFSVAANSSFGTQGQGFVTVPANAVAAAFAFNIYTLGAGAFVFSLAQPMVSAATASQTAHPAWVAGPDSAPAADVTIQNLPINLQIGSGYTFTPPKPITSSTGNSLTLASTVIATTAGSYSLPAATITGLAAATGYVVFWDRQTNAYLAVTTGLTGYFTSLTRYLYIATGYTAASGATGTGGGGLGGLDPWINFEIDWSLIDANWSLINY